MELTLNNKSPRDRHQTPGTAQALNIKVGKSVKSKKRGAKTPAPHPKKVKNPEEIEIGEVSMKEQSLSDEGSSPVKNSRDSVSMASQTLLDLSKIE